MKSTSDDAYPRTARPNGALEIRANGTFEIRANGEARSVAPGTSVAGFLARHDLDPDLVVVERNGRILRREEFDGTVLAPDDELEIVHFVGGG